LIKDFFTRRRIVATGIFAGFFTVNMLPLHMFGLASDTFAVLLNAIVAFSLSSFCALKIK